MILDNVTMLTLFAKAGISGTRTIGGFCLKSRAARTYIEIPSRIAFKLADNPRFSSVSPSLFKPSHHTLHCLLANNSHLITFVLTGVEIYRVLSLEHQVTQRLCLAC